MKIDKSAVLDAIKQHASLSGIAEVYELNDRINALPATVDEWVSVADRLPNHGDWVICATENGVIYNSFEFWVSPLAKDGGIFASYDYPHGHKTITHWQPLPTPPTP